MSSVNRIKVKNTEAEAAPRFGLAEIVQASAVTEDLGSGSTESTPIIEIRKPTGTGSLVTIGAAAIAAGGYGDAYTGRPFVRFAGSDPSPGDTLAAKAGQWEAEADGGGTTLPVEGDVRTRGTAPDEFKIVRVVIGEGGGGGSTTVKTGLVVSGSAATLAESCEPLTEGSVSVREFVVPPVWSADEAYGVGDIVNLTVAEHDEAATYQTGDLAMVGDEVMQLDAGPETGVYDAADWTKVADQGDRFCAASAVDAGPWDAAEWDSTESLVALAAEVTLSHKFPFAPAADSLAVWIDSEVIELQQPISDLVGGQFKFEMDSRGTLAARIRSSTYTSPWSVIPVSTCATSGPTESPSTAPT